MWFVSSSGILHLRLLDLLFADVPIDTTEHVDRLPVPQTDLAPYQYTIQWIS